MSFLIFKQTVLKNEGIMLIRSIRCISLSTCRFFKSSTTSKETQTYKSEEVISRWTVKIVPSHSNNLIIK
uniref:Uncharacterized protein n=1 Tax=Octopus bimaculoides TaxID=37653 RepID=A0A0L8G6A8_OCTBM